MFFRRKTKTASLDYFNRVNDRMSGLLEGTSVLLFNWEGLRRTATHPGL